MEQSASAIKTGDELVKYWTDMAKKYPIALLEDPCDEADFTSHGKLTSQIGGAVEIVGDDLYCTNPKIVAKGIKLRATNAMLLKVNQIGSVSEAGLEAFLNAP